MKTLKDISKDLILAGLGTVDQQNEEIKDLLLEKASSGFDWSEISPTIFGAVFGLYSL